MSPSSKLSSVGLLPAWWGKMVLTRDFLLRLRPDDCDTEWDRGNSLMLPWSGERIRITEMKMTHLKSPLHPSARYLSGGRRRRRWAAVWGLGWTCWRADWSLEAALEEAPGGPGSSEEPTDMTSRQRHECQTNVGTDSWFNATQRRLRAPQVKRRSRRHGWWHHISAAT